MKISTLLLNILLAAMLILGFLTGCAQASSPTADLATNPPPTSTPAPTPTASPWESVAHTPPMGWNTFNYFGCGYDETVILEIADAMVESGMQAVGYEYVNLDDCWMARERAADGNLVPDPEKFPNGIQPVIDYIHNKGLKIGAYLDRGTQTCAGYPGSYGYEEQDARLLASWGFDYLKYDNCDSVGKLVDDFTTMHDALVATGRPIVFSMCTWGFPGSYFVDLDLVHMWRTTSDIQDNWKSVMTIMGANNAFAAYAGPGRWNDPDMLEVGNGGMTDIEYKTHFTLWALMAAPLIAGNDLRSMNQTTKEILTAPEVIAINQDELGVQGKRVTSYGKDFQVWYKILSGENVRAVALFNATEEPADITVHWDKIDLPAGPALVRDLWERADLGEFSDSYTAANIPPHGVVLVKIVSAVE